MVNQIPPRNDAFSAGTQNASLIIIDPNGDLIINLYRLPAQSGESFVSFDGRVIAGRILSSMRVSKFLLQANSKTLALKFREYETAWAAEGANAVFNLQEDNILSMELWFRAIHKVDIPEAFYDIEIKAVYCVLQTRKVYEFPVEKLDAWFARYIAHKGGNLCVNFKFDELPQLLYPCQEFDEPHSFAHITRKLVYGCAGHIDDVNPTPEWEHLAVMPRILGGLNGARSSLKIVIHKHLYPSIRKFLHSSCSCKKKGLYSYMMALDMTGAWPLEESMHGKDAMSVHAILAALGTFRYKVPNHDCGLCSADYFNQIVVPGIDDAAVNFDGLCLDCINVRHKKNKARRDFRPHWDSGCRIKHGEPSWWFSYLASRQPDEQNNLEPGVQEQGRKRQRDEDHYDELLFPSKRTCY